MELTKEQKAGAAVVLAIADAIRSLKEVPSGHLYAAVMDKVSLNTYNQIIDILIKAGRVRREPSHLLVWIGGGL